MGRNVILVMIWVSLVLVSMWLGDINKTLSRIADRPPPDQWQFITVPRGEVCTVELNLSKMSTKTARLTCEKLP